jgi:hypothetical protein
MNVAKAIQSIPTLVTEDPAERAELAVAIIDHIKPSNIFLEILVGDLVDAIWHLMRLQRCRTSTINIAYRKALAKLLSEELDVEEFQADSLSNGWFRSKEGREAVLVVLRRFRLDETSLEAEAMRLVQDDLQALDDQIHFAESRRNKILKTIEKVQSVHGRRARAISDQIADSEARRAEADAGADK